MKPLEHQNHYEALEVATSATPEEIERAYRLVRSAYADDSLALYSIFDESDASAVRERIEHAYHVLSDPESRRQYDAGLEPERRAPIQEPVPEPAPAPLEPMQALEEIEDVEEGQDFDGARLRRARLRRGIELGQISEITKVNPDYLIAIEEENFEGMPAPVYVRGFVVAYAQVLGLDAAVVADSYMPRLDAARKSRGRGRLLGGRRSVEDRG